ncbi:MAG: DegT/DnrJ/EryC1/StrS family aminotransferase [Chloroflexota bacterium]|nr:DegT/DnrJ/EryC1/StrS family aminotransferase [Chloroflexota bacterium]
MGLTKQPSLEEERKVRVAATAPSFSPEAIEFVTSRLRTMLENKAFLSMGPYCEEFEQRFAQYVGAKYAAATNSGTSALEIICRALNVKGKEVVVATNTFAASAYAVINAGGKPVFADVAGDLCMDPADLERRLTPKTAAVMTVDIGGLVSPNTLRIQEICRRQGVPLIEDACQAHGTTLGGKQAGTFGIAGAFSFFPTKLMTTGEGGMLVTDDEHIYKEALILRNQGKDETRNGPYQNFYDRMGYNWRLTEIAALIGISQLAEVEQFIHRRHELARLYDRLLGPVESIRILKTPPQVRHNYYKYVAFLDGQDREALQARMKDEFGVSLSGYVYEIPLHKQPIFKRYSPSALPVSEKLCATHICLPLYPSLKNEEAEYVAASLKKCLTCA